MSIYDIPAVDMTVRNSSQTLEVELVGINKSVLDVGCATGYLARALVERGCAVTGVEYELEAAALARPSLVELIVADLNDVELADQLDGKTFDSIVFGDVLEHLADPDRVLKSATKLLAPGGSVVISVPNVTHGSLRLALLQGRWDYRDSGLLDRTHVRFFTRESALAMVRSAGLVVTHLWATVLDPLGCEVEIDADQLPWAVVDWVRHQADASVYQFVLRAELGQDDGTTPELVPAVDVPDLDDVHTERGRIEARLHRGTDGREDVVSEVLETRRHILTLRDHAIGAEAAVGSARLEVERARAAEKSAQDETERIVAELKSSATWRVGTRVVSPLSTAKRLVQGASD
ncbi:MAG: methyltransferase domain-containing protein [Cellulomonas sp.]|nr:methyltransferase domain-containing protein [Cellulomonas sp.]